MAQVRNIPKCCFFDFETVNLNMKILVNGKRRLGRQDGRASCIRSLVSYTLVHSERCSSLFHVLVSGVEWESVSIKRVLYVITGVLNSTFNEEFFLSQVFINRSIWNFGKWKMYFYLKIRAQFILFIYFVCLLIINNNNHPNFG